MVTRSREISCVPILAADQAGDKDANGKSTRQAAKSKAGRILGAE